MSQIKIFGLVRDQEDETVSPNVTVRFELGVPDEFLLEAAILAMVCAWGAETGRELPENLRALVRASSARLAEIEESLALARGLT